MDNYYSNFKAAHHQNKIKQLKKGEMITPIFAQIDLTNQCNLNCNFCSYKMGNYAPNQFDDFNIGDKLDKNLVFDLLKGFLSNNVKALEWTGGGEPTLHPDYKEIFKFAQDYEQALVTNGTLLDDEGIDIIKDFSWVRFSIDSSTEETYEKIKGKNLFSKSLENLKKLIAVKNPENVVGFSFIICRDNYQEIYEATKLAKSLGCDNIRFSLAYTPQKEKMFEGIWDEVINQLEKAKQAETKKFKVFAFSNRINELSQKVTSDSCYYNEFVTVIGSDGALYPCCLHKYSSRFNFGNLKDNSFKEIWFGDKRKKFIEEIRKGCNYCCWFSGKNKLIEYLLEENPKHVNFI